MNSKSASNGTYGYCHKSFDAAEARDFAAADVLGRLIAAGADQTTANLARLAYELVDQASAS
jgi:hypothetical protein